MSEQVKVNGLTLTLKDFKQFDTNIPKQFKPTGPLVNVSDLEGTIDTPYTVTVLAYLPGGQELNDIPVERRTGLPLQGNQIYLNYEGVKVVTTTDRNGNRQLVDCRNFKVEFNCEEEAEVYDLYYIQFDYELCEGTPSVNAILVRDQDDDPETDRGTVTMPRDGED